MNAPRKNRGDCSPFETFCLMVQAMTEREPTDQGDDVGMPICGGGE